MSTKLLIIDPQKDFCVPESPNYADLLLNLDYGVSTPHTDFVRNGGALYVTGADVDCERTAKLIRRLSTDIDEIHVTLDSHNEFDIAHPLFWVDKDGNHPPIFTIISLEDVVEGRWLPSSGKIEDDARATLYVGHLKRGGKYPLCIWPPHCIVGSEGHAIQDDVSEAIRYWGNEAGKAVRFVHKGLNPWTEHYSAVKAEVPEPNDPSTQVDLRWIKELRCDNLIILGQALSHCVNSTVRDLVKHLDPATMTLVTDCCSNVTGFEANGDEFVKTFKGLGGNTALSTEVAA
jgi:nicotinamidase-related amidase